MRFGNDPEVSDSTRNNPSWNFRAISAKCDSYLISFPYHEVTSITWATGSNLRGGLAIRLILKIRHDTEINMMFTMTQASEVYWEFQNLCVAPVAARMMNEYVTHREMKWTSFMILTDEAISFDPQATGLRVNLKKIPFSKVSGYAITNGAFFLYEPGSLVPLLSVAVGEPNFYPGLVVFLQLHGERIKQIRV
jgi:hypothetical protein